MSVKAIMVGASGRMGKEILIASKESNVDLVGAVDVISVGEDYGRICCRPG